jgi:Mg-chelatase subunit ChlI
MLLGGSLNGRCGMKMEAKDRSFSFAAIVNHDHLKMAYLANIANPLIGGLLISGPKGTGKSTVVHSIERLLPEYRAVKGCIFRCDPDKPQDFCTLCKERPELVTAVEKMRIVNLPLSCSEDRLVGSIDIEKLLKEGRKDIQRGILGEANRNILYVDEVNLLPDHLVDDILDAAASHWSTIERESISVSHPSEFVLVGTMNPEEGELRPQILDRFPLCARVRSITDPDLRVQIVKANLLYEEDPGEFRRLYEEKEGEIRAEIVAARSRLPNVEVEDRWLYAIAESCSELKVDGQRPDIIIARTARTLAALSGREKVSDGDVLLSADLALNHRTRDGGALEPPNSELIRGVFERRIERSSRGREVQKRPRPHEQRKADPTSGVGNGQEGPGKKKTEPGREMKQGS